MSNYPSLTFHATLRSSRAGNVTAGMSATHNTIALDTGKVVTGAGTYNHNQLRNRDMENQHPVTAITGLNTHLNTLDNNTAVMRQDIDSVALTAGQLGTRMTTAEARIVNLQNGKVDKESGKGLSANDFTDELKEKLEAVDPDASGLPSGGRSGDVLICSGGNQGEWKAPATSVSQDNTLPITAAAVYTEIGNINALLETI